MRQPNNKNEMNIKIISINLFFSLEFCPVDPFSLSSTSKEKGVLFMYFIFNVEQKVEFLGKNGPRILRISL